MTRRLPPLNALRAFDAAARRGSFQAAALEIGVTPAAISQHIKFLEQALGSQLFLRFHRGVELTSAGSMYSRKIAEALDIVAAATSEINQYTGSNVLRVTVLPVLAEMWLLPRMSRFQELNPDIELLLSTDAPVVDFRNAEFDIGLRYTDGIHPGLIVRKLFDETLFPVCSPELARSLRTVDDLSSMALLYDQHWRDDWHVWLRAVGRPELIRSNGSAFGLYSMATAAAKDGLGVLIGHSRLIEKEISSGKLVAPFSQTVPATYAHYVAWPPWVSHKPAVKAFVSWVQREARSTTHG